MEAVACNEPQIRRVVIIGVTFLNNLGFFARLRVISVHQVDVWSRPARADQLVVVVLSNVPHIQLCKVLLPRFQQLNMVALQALLLTL